MLFVGSTLFPRHNRRASHEPAFFSVCVCVFRVCACVCSFFLFFFFLYDLPFNFSVLRKNLEEKKREKKM